MQRPRRPFLVAHAPPSRPAPATASSEIPSPLDACPCSSHQQHHLPHPRQLRQAVPRHRHRLRHLLAPNEHLRRTTLRARLSTPSAPRIAPPGCAPLTAAISHLARRIQARREHPQRYITLSLEVPPAARRKHKEHHQRPAQQPQRRLPIPHAAFFTTVLSYPHAKPLRHPPRRRCHLPCTRLYPTRKVDLRVAGRRPSICAVAV
ncbi:hypothetical protein B0H14DRAFT_104929 [Mycena olivaceomarginata]|nr:hypothetical protein B0H14DRAFT_104929 [Mycena olivaceomarginata]